MGFPTPQPGASLILSFPLQKKTTVLLGSGMLAASRAFAALEAGSAVVILSHGGTTTACDELKWRAEYGQVTVVDFDSLPCSSTVAEENKDVEALDHFLKATHTDISFVCITDTISGSPFRRSRQSAEKLYSLCKAKKILVNTTDMPDLCDFSFTSNHRFEDSSGAKAPLQVGVTTNGQGCRLAGRIRREIVGKLPKEVGLAVEKVGKMRALAKAGEDFEVADANEDCFEDTGVTTPNRPVPQRSKTETASERAKRRMKWVAQISEYWSIQRLSKLTEEEMGEILSGEHGADDREESVPIPSIHSLTLQPPVGRILLVGSGPGHPSLLTLATHTALTKLAHLVLSDKLVPDAVLALIPSHVDVRIAKKFPGNAEGAQNEMMEAAVEAAKRGLTVVRLKQGDPVVYGRAGEEVLYFRERGFEPVVVPGVTSAIAAPTFAGIPVTQRGVAESFFVCTGVGRKGKEVQLPGYERGRTLVILMGVARLSQVVSTLLALEEGHQRIGKAYPPHTPIAIIERASMPDQRVLESTLKDVVQALENLGEQRPPGMIIVGWVVLALWRTGNVNVLDEGAENRDAERVIQWLGGPDAPGWRVREGLSDEWESL
ncbi:uroporphyrin-iii c-methyltransferase [Moniliophthora roreri MCA 2997]|uniref:precorrin-2 dehydrogenase n=2 Tax=Moniliophthora roreri TaxID=221103 RepID=V2Y9R7_MONRO|nr:uroporphyrin-iii c-methyltransferase [Moniliophthora roreri MCA 2997]KAI3610476.1 uroporphyrin-iii c-methyltransferase [Moniliophthora roreri]